MKFGRVFVLLFVLAALLLLAGPAQSATPGPVIVNSGGSFFPAGAESDHGAGEADGVSGLPTLSYIWVGKRVDRLASSNIFTSSQDAPGILSTSAYSATLAPIAARLGTSMWSVLNTNKLYNPGIVLAGQRLAMPGGKASPTPPPTTGKWIDVDIGSQTTTAYVGNAPFKTVLVSTGSAWRQTPTGSFKVYLKVPSQTMSGGIGADRYYLPGVPWIMYFSGQNGLHGAYWHNNFGVPMSHGCVNLSVHDAKWFYDWGAVGMPVVVHE